MLGTVSLLFIYLHSSSLVETLLGIGTRSCLVLCTDISIIEKEFEMKEFVRLGSCIRLSENKSLEGFPGLLFCSVHSIAFTCKEWTGDEKVLSLLVTQNV